MRNLLAALLIAGLFAIPVGCGGDEGPAEQTGEALDEAAEEAAEAVEHRAQHVEEAFDENGT